MKKVLRVTGRVLLGVLSAGVLSLTAGLATGEVQVYDGLNAGIVMAHSWGVEVRGEPGVFACDGQC